MSEPPLADQPEWRLAPAAPAADAPRLHRDNVAAWDEAAAEYGQRIDATIAFLRAGNSNLHPVERDNLLRVGPLRQWCQDAVHLQCASGRDTLSLLNEGVGHVAGVDISPVHIANARRAAQALGADAEWYVADVLDAPESLDGRFDLVYTGRGALCWLHDLRGWGRVAARLLRPGGVLHVFDSHPFAWFWDEGSTDLRVAAEVGYFDQAAVSVGFPSAYLPGLRASASKWERNHTVADTVGAVLEAGLVLEHLGEHREDYWDSLPRMRAEERARIPLTLSLMARKPAP